ncbi:hypothetical protein MTO96_018709 [Rhipicephalus appendiculatus]
MLFREFLRELKNNEQTLGSLEVGGLADLPPPTSGGVAAPAFLHEPPVQVVFSNMTGALVSCSASGQPRPVISWTNESGSSVEHIPGLRRARPDGTLEFFPFRGEDYRQEVHASRYRCRASNTLGSGVQPKRPCQSRVLAAGEDTGTAGTFLLADWGDFHGKPLLWDLFRFG